MKMGLRSTGILAALVPMFLNGCASNYRRPESIEAKMGRFQSRARPQNVVPELPTMDVPATALAGPSGKTAGNRAPASVAATDKTDIDQDLSNKRLYFTALLGQYQELRSFATKGGQALAQCPHFHSAFLGGTTGGQLTRRDTNYTALLADPSSPARYPELALPLSKDGTTPTVWEMAQSKKGEKPQEMVQDAVNIHVAKVHAELMELCETGVSDNYYIFENLITYTKAQGGPHPSMDNVRILMRTTLFVNKALVQSLGRAPRAPASKKPSATFDEVLKRLDATWAWNYFSHLQQ